jgi:hypothetical protein
MGPIGVTTQPFLSRCFWKIAGEISPGAGTALGCDEHPIAKRAMASTMMRRIFDTSFSAIAGVQFSSLDTANPEGNDEF